MNTRIEKQLEFIIEIDKSKNIFRQNYNTDGERKENDAEHQWHIAVMAFLFGEYAPEGTDLLRAVQMALVHDLVEIDAGDTYVYDPAAGSDKSEREQAAADRIFSLLPEDQSEYVRNLWEEFEKCESKEAKFCKAMDVLQPILMNSTTGRSWLEHGIKKEQPEQRAEYIKDVSPELWQAAMEILDKAESESKFCK